MKDARRPLVLVVDDDAAIRELFCQVLAIEGFQTATATDGLEALAALERQVPAAILLDMAMPNASGLTVLQRIRERDETKHVPVIVVTAVARDDDLWDGREWGWDMYLSKPVDMSELVNALRKLVP